MTMYADNESEIREWIQDGVTKRVRADPEQMKLREGAAIEMPSFRQVLSEGDLAAVVAYVKAVSDFEKPEEAGAEAGRQVAIKYGCFNCHGPQGRGALDNPGSLKGYVPAWDGPDYAELVAQRRRGATVDPGRPCAALAGEPAGPLLPGPPEGAHARVPEAPGRGRPRRAPGLHPLAPAAPVLSLRTRSPAAVTAGKGRGTVALMQDTTVWVLAKRTDPTLAVLDPPRLPESASSSARPSTSFATRRRRTRSSCARWAGSWWSPRWGSLRAFAGSTRAPRASST